MKPYGWQGSLLVQRRLDQRSKVGPAESRAAAGLVQLVQLVQRICYVCSERSVRHFSYTCTTNRLDQLDQPRPACVSGWTTLDRRLDHVGPG